MDKKTRILLEEFHRNTMLDIKAMVFCEDHERLSTEYIRSLFDLESRIFNQLINTTDKG